MHLQILFYFMSVFSYEHAWCLQELECLHIQHTAEKSILRNLKYHLKKVQLSEY